MAQHPQQPEFHRTLQRLERFPVFCDMWNEQGVALGRDRELMRVRDLDKGVELGLLAQVYPLPDPTREIQLYQGIRWTVDQH
jgi:hypothetical protein